MAVLPVSSDYTSLDKSALDERVQALIESAFPTWTDHARANFGNVLNEMNTHVGDVLAFLQNKHLREAFVVWALQMKHMLAHARAVGFTPRGKVAAQVTETFTISAATAGDVVFPVGTVVRSKGGNAAAMQLLTALTIAAGSTSGSETVEHSQNVVDSLTSDGTPNQTFDLSALDYLDDSLVLVFGAVTYTQVDNFLGSTATDAHFTLWVDENGRGQITLGNGVNGKIPPKDTVGTATYKVGGGLAGNVEAHKLTAIDGVFFDTLGNPVIVTVDNAAGPDVLGEERMSVEAIRQLIPPYIRSRVNTISRDDFETNALLVPGVGRALMLSNAEDPGIPENRGYLRIVPTGGGTPSSILKAAVTTMVTVTNPPPVGFGVSVLDPLYFTVNPHVKLWARAGYDPDDVAALVRAMFTVWFAPTIYDVSDDAVLTQAAVALWGADWRDLIDTPNTLVNFGYYMVDSDGNPYNTIALSDMADIVHDTPGVLRLGTALADFTLNGSHDDLEVGNEYFPEFGTCSIVNGATGGAL